MFARHVRCAAATLAMMAYVFGVGAQTPAEMQAVQSGSGSLSGAQPVNKDFDFVTSKLDKGGTFYFYTDMDQALERTAQTYLGAFATAAGNERQARELTAMARALIQSTGLGAMSDFGMSVVPLSADLNRTKAYLHLKEIKGLFTLRGGEPKQLEATRFITKDVSVAIVQDITFSNAIPVVTEMMRSVKGAMGESQLQQMFANAKKRGVDLEKLSNSLAGEFGFSFRVHQGYPKAVIFAATKDQTVYDTLVAVAKLDNANLTDATSGSVNMKIFANRKSENYQPCFAQIDNWTLFATHPDELVRAAEARKAEQTLTDLPEYRKLAADLPTRANGLIYFSKTLASDVQRMFEQSGAGVGARMSMILLPLLTGTSGHVGVRVNEPEGVFFMVQGDRSAAVAMQGVLAMPAAAPLMAAVAVPNYLEAGVRSKVSRVRSDQRSMATGIEAYFVDNNKYPPSTTDADKSVMKFGPGEKVVPSFQGGALTTPIAYITSLFPDAFAAPKPQTFGYYSKTTDSDKTGWVLFSTGPDKKFDLEWELYDPSKPQPSPELLRFFYDPTNGTVSGGDIVRVKQ